MEKSFSEKICDSEEDDGQQERDNDDCDRHLKQVVPHMNPIY
jgi:hypothetical protein